MEQKKLGISDAARLLASPEGRALIAYLQETGGEALQQAMALAASGRGAEAQALLQPLVQDGRGAELYRAALGGIRNGRV